MIPAMLLFDPRDVAAAIIQLRGDRKQVDMAEKAGISKSQWSKYESGKQRSVMPKTLASILKSLGCSESELLEAVLKARARRLGVQESVSLTSGEAGSGASDFQRLTTELHALRAQLTMLSTYFIGLNQKIEQALGERPST